MCFLWCVERRVAKHHFTDLILRVTEPPCVMTTGVWNGYQKNGGLVQVLGQGVPNLDHTLLLMMMTWRTHRRMPQISGYPRETRRTPCLRELRQMLFRPRNTRSQLELSIVQQRKKLFKDLVRKFFFKDRQVASFVTVQPLHRQTHHRT
jgi:hypothetical protein